MLDRRSLNRALLARQLLLHPAASGTSVADVLERLVGLQSQNPGPPYVALWTRMTGFHPAELSALIQSRAAVRLALMRSTVHLVTAADCRFLRPLLIPAIARALTPGSQFGRHLIGLDRAAFATRARQLVEDTPSTPAELGARLADEFPGRDPAALANAARADLPLVQIPPRGLWGPAGRTVCTTAEHWLDAPMQSDPDPELLVRRYLAAFGPASVADLQTWSGLTRLASVVQGLADELIRFTDERGRSLWDLPDAPRPAADAPAPVRLLAEFDAVLLGHADKERLLDEPSRRRVFTVNGLIKPAVLVDGFVDGIWNVRDGVAQIEPFGRWSASVRSAVLSEVEGALAFLAPDVPPRHTLAHMMIAAMAMARLLESAQVVAIPLRHRFRGIDVREAVLLRGPAGWAEFAPFREYDDQECVPWLRSALEAAGEGWPSPVRDRVEVNAIVPVVDPEVAAAIARRSGCRTVKLKVADPGMALGRDAERVAAVRDVLGPDGRIRVDANGAWSVDEAVRAIAELDRAAGGLEYVEQPCRSIAEMAAVRCRVDVPIAADESIRREQDPIAVARAGAADIAVLKVPPLGGVRAALRIAEQAGLPVVVSSALDTAVGLAAGLALAGALPDLQYACGLGSGALLRSDVSSAGLRPVDGWLTVVDTAPEPDLRDGLLADSQTTGRWLDRVARVAQIL